MMYGYCRCSTDETMQKVGRQELELIKMGVDPENIYKEYVRGVSTNKGELNKLLGVAKEGDVIAVTEASRISRSAEQLKSIVALALDKKLNLRIGSLIFDCRYPLDPMALQVINLMGAQVEAEVLYLSQRVSSGMKNAKANGVVIGRPKTTKENLPAEFLEVYPQYMDGMSVTACAKRCGVSRQTFYKYLRILEQS